jgi:integrase
MTRPRNEIPKLRRHKAKNRAFFQFRGKRYNTGAWGSREAEQIYCRLIAEVVLPTLGDEAKTIPPAPTVAGDQLLVEDLAAEFLDYVVQRHPPPSREADNIGYAIKELLELHARTPVVAFTPRALLTFRAHIMRPDRAGGVQGKRQLCRRSVNRRVDFVRKMFKWGVSREMVPAAVWQTLTTIDGLRRGEFGLTDRPPVQDATIEDVRAVLPHLSRIVRTMLRVQCLTGMRSGELVTMRKGDISIEGDRWFYRPRRHKTQHHGKSREIELLPVVQRELKPFMLRPDEAYLFSPREAEAESHAEQAALRKTPVQPSQQARHERALRNEGQHMNDHYATDSYGRAIARGCKRAGLTAKGRAWSPHRIRHAATTWMVTHTDGHLPSVAKAVGHSSTKTTERYTHLGRDQAAKALKSLEALDALLDASPATPPPPGPSQIESPHRVAGKKSAK